MRIRYLEAGDYWIDGRRSVPSPAGWWVDLGDGSYSGPFATSDEAEQAVEMIRRGEVDDLPLIEMEE